MVRFTGIALAALLFVGSLPFETLIYADDSSFLIGIVCALLGFGYLAWYANPLNVVAGVLLLSKRDRWAVGTAVLATALALSTFTIDEVPRNEAGHEAPVTGYGAGFILWLSSSIVLLGTSLYCALSPRT